MKNAIEWAEEFRTICGEKQIKQIQFDAWKEGMLDAANIADKFADYDTSRDGRVITSQILDLIASKKEDFKNE